MAYARFGLKDGWWGSTITTSRVAVASNTRDRAMIFSVREKASSGATRRVSPRPPAGNAGKGDCIRRVGYDAGSNRCAIPGRVLLADLPSRVWQARTKRRIGNFRRPGGWNLAFAR